MIDPAPAEAVNPAAGPHHHQALSELLNDLISEPPENGALTLNRLLVRSEGRGIYLFMIILCLPFLQPLPLFGLSTPLGLMITILALRHAFGLAPRLPRRIGERPLPDPFKQRVIGGSSRVLKRLEKWVKPRRDHWLASVPSRCVHCSLIAILALLLSLPLPPFILFSNIVPGYVLVLICVSMMEEDGALIWLAYLGLIGNAIYFGALVASAGLIIKHWKEWLDVVWSWL